MCPRSPCAAVLAGFLALYLWMGLRDPMVHLADFFGHAGSAEAVGGGPLERLAGPWYPAGYPLLLRPAIEATGHPVVAARWIAALSAVLALGALCRLARQVTGEGAVALLAVVCTGLSPPFLQWAAAEGTDMPCVAFLLLSAMLLTSPAARPFAAGMAVGIAYDFRFAALVPALAQGAWIAAFGLPASERPRGRALAEYAIGALVGAAPQLFLTWWVHGVPVRSFMAKNVWFGIYGENNWQGRWDLVPDDIGLIEVVRLDPGRFFRHWLGNLAGLATGTLAFPGRIAGHGLNVLLPFGAIHAAYRLRGAAGFWYCSVFAYTGALAMAFLGPRYLLPIVPAMAVACCWFLWHTVTPRFRLTASIALVALKLAFDLTPALELPASTRRALAIDAALRSSGMTHASKVLATSSDYYDLRTLGRFVRWEADKPEPVSRPDELAGVMRRRNLEFALYDKEYGLEKVLPGLGSLLEAEKPPPAGLERILILEGQDPVALFRLLPR